MKTVTVTRTVVAEIPVPCFEPGDGPPKPAETLKSVDCTEGLELCFDKLGAFDLTNYVADLISYSRRANAGCSHLSQGESGDEETTETD